MDDTATRRDFIYIAALGGAVIGTGLSAWPFIDSFNPAADTLARSKTEVDVSSMQLGQRLTIAWRERPVFIVRRTLEAIAQARVDDNDDTLIDPQNDADRVLTLNGWSSSVSAHIWDACLSVSPVVIIVAGGAAGIVLVTVRCTTFPVASGAVLHRKIFGFHHIILPVPHAFALATEAKMNRAPCGYAWAAKANRR